MKTALVCILVVAFVSSAAYARPEESAGTFEEPEPKFFTCPSLLCSTLGETVFFDVKKRIEFEHKF